MTASINESSMLGQMLKTAESFELSKLGLEKGETQINKTITARVTVSEDDLRKHGIGDILDTLEDAGTAIARALIEDECETILEVSGTLEANAAHVITHEHSIELEFDLHITAELHWSLVLN